MNTLTICTVNYYKSRENVVNDQTKVIQEVSKLSSINVEHIVISKNYVEILNTTSSKKHKLPTKIANSNSLSFRRNFAKSLCSGEYLWMMDDDVVIDGNILGSILDVLINKKPEGTLIAKSVNYQNNKVLLDLLQSSVNRGAEKYKVKELKFSFFRLHSLLRARSIELIFNKRHFQNAHFDESRGVGVNNHVGAETMFCFTKGIPPVSLFTGGVATYHKGNSTGGNMTFSRLYNSNHIQQIFYSLFPKFIAGVLISLYFSLKWVQLWKRG